MLDQPSAVKRISQSVGRLCSLSELDGLLREILGSFQVARLDGESNSVGEQILNLSEFLSATVEPFS